MCWYLFLAHPFLEVLILLRFFLCWSFDYSCCDCCQILGLNLTLWYFVSRYDSWVMSGCSIHHYHVPPRASGARWQVLWCQVQKQGMCFFFYLFLFCPFNIAESVEVEGALKHNIQTQYICIILIFFLKEKLKIKINKAIRDKEIFWCF